jgi:hypothetical protein
MKTQPLKGLGWSIVFLHATCARVLGNINTQYLLVLEQFSRKYVHATCVVVRNMCTCSRQNLLAKFVVVVTVARKICMHATCSRVHVQYVCTCCTQHFPVFTCMGLAVGLAMDQHLHATFVVARNMCTYTACAVARNMCPCTTCVVARNMYTYKTCETWFTQHVRVWNFMGLCCSLAMRLAINQHCRARNMCCCTKNVHVHMFGSSYTHRQQSNMCTQHVLHPPTLPNLRSRCRSRQT